VTNRIGPLFGLLGAACTLFGLAMSDIAGLDVVNPLASAETVAEAVRDNIDRFQMGSGLLLTGLFLLVWFLVYLPERLGEGTTAVWPAKTAGAAGLITVTLMALVAAYVRAVTHTPIAGADSIVVKGVVYFDWDYLRTLAPFVSASLAGIGMSGLTAGSLPRGIAWPCLILAAVPLVLPPGIITSLYFLVLALLSIYLVLRPTRPSSDPKILEPTST
jgi:hypothetical protein